MADGTLFLSLSLSLLISPERTRPNGCTAQIDGRTKHLRTTVLHDLPEIRDNR